LGTWRMPIVRPGRVNAKRVQTAELETAQCQFLILALNIYFQMSTKKIVGNKWESHEIFATPARARPQFRGLSLRIALNWFCAPAYPFIPRPSYPFVPPFLFLPRRKGIDGIGRNGEQGGRRHHPPACAATASPVATTGTLRPSVPRALASPAMLYPFPFSFLHHLAPISGVHQMDSCAVWKE
jgi:hypothetical protein